MQLLSNYFGSAVGYEVYKMEVFPVFGPSTSGSYSLPPTTPVVDLLSRNHAVGPRPVPGRSGLGTVRVRDLVAASVAHPSVSGRRSSKTPIVWLRARAADGDRPRSGCMETA